MYQPALVDADSRQTEDTTMGTWRVDLPELHGKKVRLREPVAADAPSLLREICTPEVCRHVPPPPTTLAEVEQLIARMSDWRIGGRGFGFVIQAAGEPEAAGLIQFLSARDRRLIRTSTSVPWEWGFAVGTRYWGTGIFLEAAWLALSFAFERVGLYEVDAWVLQQNQRANAALAKLGASSAVKLATRAPDGRFGDFIKWTSHRGPLPLNGR